MLNIVLASFIIMLAAFGGAVSFWQYAGGLINRYLNLLISFTAGLFLFVTYQLAGEAFHHAPGWEPVVWWFLVGMVLVWLPLKLIPPMHHQPHCPSTNYRTIDIRRILLGNGLHNVGDGVLLAAAFSVNIPLGLAATVSVFIHELVQETATFFVLRRSGFKITTALLINFLVSGTILIGSIGGFLLLDTFMALETPLLALSAGAFLVVILADLIPHSLEDTREAQNHSSHILAFLIGLLLMAGIGTLTGHSHDHADDYHEDHSADHQSEHDNHHLEHTPDHSNNHHEHP